MRHFSIILVLSLLFVLFSSCDVAPSATKPQDTKPPSTATAEVVTPSPANETKPPVIETDSPTPSPSETPENWKEIFGEFLETEYDRLIESFVSGIAGIGFIDLDVDGSPELIIFDSGASASMGVQIFDIIGREVECVSANIELVGETFGAGHMSRVAISANEFAAFRLMRDTAAGERLFVADSGNGGPDFLYAELIKLGEGEDGEVTVSKFLSKYEEYEESEEGGRELVSRRFEYMGEEADEERYNSLLSEYEAACEDTGYEAHGVFLWEDVAYEKEVEGLFTMFDAAVKAYVQIPD